MGSPRLSVAALLCASFSASLLFCGNVLGQGPRRGQPISSQPKDDVSVNLKIRSIDGMGSSGLVRTPEYRVDNVPRESSAVKDWAMIRVKYDTLPEWIDQLTFKYYILLKTEDPRAADTPYTMLEGLVTYSDVKKGDNHISTVFLHPNTLERYGEVVACGVEIAYKDETVYKSDVSGKARLRPGKWWTGIRNEPTVTSKSGYVLSRAETPFAFVNYDTYEQIRR